MSDLEKMNGVSGVVMNGQGANQETPEANGSVGGAALNGIEAPGDASNAAAGNNGEVDVAAGGAGGGDTGTAATLKAVESAISCSTMAGDDAGTDAGISSVPPSEAGGRPPLDTACSDGGGPSSLVGGMVGPPSPLTGCYLLIILGEPHSEEHKDNILQHLLKGKSEHLHQSRSVVKITF